jgi:hypothetical protein
LNEGQALETILMNQHLSSENCEFIKPRDISMDISQREAAR